MKKPIKYTGTDIARLAETQLKRDMFEYSCKDKGILHDTNKIRFKDYRAEGKTRSILLIGGCGVVSLIIASWAIKHINTHYEIKLLNAETWAAIFREMMKKALEQKQPSSSQSIDDNGRDNCAQDDLADNETEVRNWLENFDIEFVLELFNFPDILDEYIVNCPPGFEVPVILALTTELAPCFSKVKAKYIDGQYHRPNIITIIEGSFGCGKSNFERIHNNLFERRITRDYENISNPDGKKHIIQTIPPLVTAPVLADILANNRAVHACVFESEIRTLDNAMKLGNAGFSYEIIRKAYENGLHCRMNRDKNAPQGSFTIAINFILTGTPKDTEIFLKKELEGGTNSRLALCVLPNPGKELPKFDMPEGDALKVMQDQIDEWTEKYAFTTDQDGNDVPVPDYEIDLSYVSKVLEEWELGQYEIGEYENNKARQDVRGRIGSTVFNCAIVWHMLYGEPNPRERGKRDAVITLALYMANYLMERWLHKFGKQHNVERAKFTAEEMVSVRRAPKPKNPNPAYQLPDDGLERGRIMWNLNQRENLSYDQIGKRYGLTKDQVSGYVHRYREKHRLKPDEEVVE